MENISQDIGQSPRRFSVIPINTDLYEITMAYSYFKQNIHEKEAVFEVFYRQPPFGGQYIIFGGLKEVLQFIQSYRWDESDINYLKSIFPDSVDPKFYDWLSKLTCDTLQIDTFEEGSIVFPREPLMRIKGPIALVQLLETGLLNLIGFPSLIATNASRMRKLLGNKASLLEFGLRRAQGPDGGLSASQYSYLGGFDSTSNVLCGKNFGIGVAGTMAHSFVTTFESLDDVDEKKAILNNVNIKQKVLEYRKQLNFEKTNDGELASYIIYALSFPAGFTALVDSYNTLHSGTPNFILVSMALQDAGFKPVGIRIDSGDLALLSKQIKSQLTKYGEIFNRDFSQIKIVVSDNINETTLVNILKDGHEIDVFGIGTNIATCQKQPALGLVYKLVEFEQMGKMKYSEDSFKATLPGSKKVFRVSRKASPYFDLDIITNTDELIEVEKECLIRDLNIRNKKYTLIPTKVEEVLKTFFKNGKITQKIKNIHEAKQYATEQLTKFTPDLFQLKNDVPFPVMVSQHYHQYLDEMQEKIIVLEQYE